MSAGKSVARERRPAWRVAVLHARACAALQALAWPAGPVIDELGPLRRAGGGVLPQQSRGLPVVACFGDV